MMRKMGHTMLESISIARPKPTEEHPQHLCLDKGYDYDEARDLGQEFGTLCTFELEMKRRKRSNARSAARLFVGWWSARIAGRIPFVVYLSAGSKRSRTISTSSISLALGLPSVLASCQYFCVMV